MCELKAGVRARSQIMSITLSTSINLSNFSRYAIAKFALMSRAWRLFMLLSLSHPSKDDWTRKGEMKLASGGNAALIKSLNMSAQYLSASRYEMQSSVQILTSGTIVQFVER